MYPHGHTETSVDTTRLTGVHGPTYVRAHMCEPPDSSTTERGPTRDWGLTLVYTKCSGPSLTSTHRRSSAGQHPESFLGPRGTGSSPRGMGATTTAGRPVLPTERVRHYDTTPHTPSIPTVRQIVRETLLDPDDRSGRLLRREIPGLRHHWSGEPGETRRGHGETEGDRVGVLPRLIFSSTG